MTFALIGFMFAAMISFVVINAAYSAASRVKKLKYDEQSFLLAQSMSGIITEALAGSGGDVMLPDEETPVTSPTGNLKYDSLTVQYQYIEYKSPASDDFEIFYNDTENGHLFSKGVYSGSSKGTFYDAFKGKTSSSNAVEPIRKMIRDMARKIDMGEGEQTDTITSVIPSGTGETLRVVTTFTMFNSYSIRAVTTATVEKGSNELSKYVVRLDASAAVRTDKLVCAGLKTIDDTGKTTAINVENFKEHTATGSKELVKVSCYSLTWPADQMRCVYAP